MDVQKVLHYFITKLVDKPEALVITQRATPEKMIYEVRVSSLDLAKIIGKEGRTFKALRSFINTIDSENRNDLVIDTTVI
ncbi:KH domain-containing protein [Candidatus Dependentiae bacterium]|nr:KH domain-containing protein [Candidatus Dependentiae bacterium]